MNKFEPLYLDLVRDVRRNGTRRESRAGNTIGMFGKQLVIEDLREGVFPILTTRKMYPRPVIGELAAFLWGADHLKQFKDFGCNYWDYNAGQWGANEGVPLDKQYLGRIYGVQWRHWNNEIDQIVALVDGIKSNPQSRRHVLTAWNPSDHQQTVLPPCHILSQAYVTSDDFLDLSVIMRSVDLCLGLPSDIILYAGFLIGLAAATGYKPGRLVFQLGDAHIYENHEASFVEQAHREPKALPGWKYTGVHFDRFVPEELEILPYDSHESIKYVLN